MRWGRSNSGLIVPGRQAPRSAQRGFFAMGPAFLGSGGGSSGGTLTLSGTAFAPATVGTAYSQYLTISGGTAPYSLTGGTGLSAGFLPPGLSLSIASGSHLLLSGTPTASTMAPFTASVTSTDSQVATSAQFVCAVRGLLAAYPLNEASGTVAKDVSGNGRNATYSAVSQTLATASILPSGAGASLEQTGAGHVALPGGFLNGIACPITIFGWGKSLNAAPGSTIGQQLVASTSGGFNLYLNSAGKIVAGVAGVTNNASDTRTMSSNTIYFWAVTIDSSGNAVIYVNATASATFSAAFTSTDKFVDYAWMGGYPSSPANNWFNGYLQNIGICNVALTATEISDLYAHS